MSREINVEMHPDTREPDLSVELAPRHPQGLRLANPVMPASGTFGYGSEYAKLVDVGALGAVITKGITLQPRRGNPQPRLVETPAGLLNSIGLQNPGVHRVVEEKSALWARLGVPVIVNIAGDTVQDYAAVAEALEDVPGVAAIEVNVSCPNVQHGCLAFGVDPVAAADVTRVVVSSTQHPVIVKLTPNAPDLVGVARAVVEAGADAVSLVNTFLGMAIDTRTGKPLLRNKTGGLSGPAIRPIALRMVYEVAQAVDVPIIGIGGIMCADDALQFIMAGATAVQVGTGLFVDPRCLTSIIEGIRDHLRQRSCSSVGEIVGLALRQ